MTSLAAVGGLAFGGNAALAAGPAGYFPLPAEARGSALRLNLGTFEPLVNTSFSIRSRAAAPTSIRLVEVVRSPSTKRRKNARPTDGFSLIFDASGKRRLKDQIYEVSHPQLGSFSMFISAVGMSGRRYQAVFNRI